MTARQALHLLVDQLPENQVEPAHVCLPDFRDAPDEDGTPFGQEVSAASPAVPNWGKTVGARGSPC